MKDSIINVNNYILGYKYNKNTIIDDINTCLDLLKNNSSYYLLNSLRNNLSNYLSNRADECVRFIYFIENNNYDNPIIYQLYERYNLPFIHSRDAKVDQLILSTLFGIDNIELSNAIYYLACFKDKSYIEKLRIKELLHDLLDNDSINFDLLSDGINLSNSLYIESDEDIVDKMEYLKTKFNKKNHTSVVGHYAELIVYNYLKERLKKEQEIKWISRDLGNDLGYDIAVINSDGSASLYEVKGIFDSDIAKISGHEHFIYRYSNNHEGLDYHFMVVLPKADDLIVDIHKDVNKQINYDYIGTRQCFVEYSDKDKKIMVRRA